ncbi:MAG: hypothetical protein JWQ19_225 [Subtercola sp.]|nr:hypothetical protein [Subtercola sp.]
MNESLCISDVSFSADFNIQRTHVHGMNLEGQIIQERPSSILPSASNLGGWVFRLFEFDPSIGRDMWFARYGAMFQRPRGSYERSYDMRPKTSRGNILVLKRDRPAARVAAQHLLSGVAANSRTSCGPDDEELAQRARGSGNAADENEACEVVIVEDQVCGSVRIIEVRLEASSFEPAIGAGIGSTEL